MNLGSASMHQTVIDIYNGIPFRVEAVPRGSLFEGRFTLLDPAADSHGADDPFRPTTDNAWATAQEALTYATEAAHHAIDGIASIRTTRRATPVPRP